MQNQLTCPDATIGFLGFFDFSIAPLLLFYSYIPIVLISLLLSLFILSKNWGSLQARLLALISIGFSLWVVAAIIHWTAVHASIVHFSWEIIALIELSIYIFSLYFVAVFLSGKDIDLKYKIVLTLCYLPVIILLPTKINMTSFDLVLCQANNGLIWLYIYTLEIASICVMMGLFIKKYITTPKDDPIRKQIPLLSVGMFLFLGIFTATNILGDATLTYEFNLIGPVGMVLFLCLLTYMIVKFKTFNVKLIGAQALVITLWALVGSLLFVVKSDTSRIIAGATLVFTTFACYLLVRSVKREVEQREQIENLAKNLEKANARLRELDKAKSEFVSIASHQLRSPLTAIRGYASMMVEGSFGKLPTKALEAAGRIEESTKLMVMSVEDYLNVSRIESGNMKYNLSDFNIKEMVEHICDDVRPEAMKKNLVLLFRSNVSSQGIVNADVGKTHQIIHNLINNSLKYTPKGSINVFVHDDTKKKRVYISITDTGIGMSEATAHTLFQKFSRADNANSVNVSGTGLGLYVALKMAEQMGGTITCASEGDGKGSTFTFELPLAM